MNLTILIGWPKADASGNPIGAPKVISGIPEDESDAQEQAAIFTAAKDLHQFSKGIAHIAFAVVEVRDRASFISDAVAEQVAGREQQRLVSLEAELKRAEEREAISKAAGEARTRLRKAAVEENNASAALQTAKHRAMDAEANYKATKAESAKTEWETEKSKLAELDAAAKTAKEELQAAKTALAEPSAPVPQFTA